MCRESCARVSRGQPIDRPKSALASRNFAPSTALPTLHPSSPARQPRPPARRAATTARFRRSFRLGAVRLGARAPIRDERNHPAGGGRCPPSRPCTGASPLRRPHPVGSPSPYRRQCLALERLHGHDRGRPADHVGRRRPRRPSRWLNDDRAAPEIATMPGRPARRPWLDSRTGWVADPGPGHRSARTAHGVWRGFSRTPPPGPRASGGRCPLRPGSFR
jgi:hypothetical protein